MENSLPVWLIPALSLTGGVIIGFILARILGSSSPQSSQKQLQELQDRFESYQSEVVNHFGVTAELVQTLNESHQKVQEHMLHSAERLALDEQSRERLLACLTDPSAKERLSAPAQSDTQQARAEPETEPTIEPPKDYAPKPEGEPGTLDENFGREK